MPSQVTMFDNKKAPVPNTFGSSGELYGATITIGAETGGNTIAVTIQLTDFRGADLATRANVIAYLSDDANGDSLTATGPSTETVIGTDGVLAALITKKVYLFISESDGDIDLTVVESGAATWYLILCMPNGQLVASEAITFAA